jgi:hypothetical protein
MPPDTRGGWTTYRDLPLGQQEYQFIVDGKGIADPMKKNSVSDGRGGMKTVQWINPVQPKKQASQETKPIPAKSPAVSQSPPATGKVVSKETPPASAVKPKPTATATPAPMDLATISKSPAQWPKTVLLKQPAAFPAVLDGKIVGEIQVPAGTQVNIVSVQAEGVTAEYRNGKKQLPAGATDIIERFEKANPR